MEKWRTTAKKITELFQDAMWGTLEETLETARNVLVMYNEGENNLSADLECNDYKDEKRNKQVRVNAKKEITQLKNFIKKYGN
jgi:hypothetical protein